MLSDGDILKVVMELVLADGTITQNVFYWLCVFAADQVLSTVVSTIKLGLENMYGAVASYMKSTITVNPAEVDRIEWDATDEEWQTKENLGTTTPSVTFTDATDQLPFQIAPVMVANTLRPKTRGRKFLPGFCEDAQQNSYLQTPAMTALGNALAYYLADLTVAGSDRLSPGVPSTATGTFQEFSNGVANDKLGTQRRRTPGIGA